MEAKTAAVQLEVAAHWMEEAALTLVALGERDAAQNLRRLAHSCIAVAKREATKC